MNTSNHNLNPQFDRLVDGELTPAEYRELLSSLDDEPDGWRRCAMAFLEAQALGQDLSALRRPAIAPARAEATAASTNDPAPPVQLPPDQTGQWSQRTWQGLYFATLAASLALAFYVGSWTSDWGGPMIADHAPAPSVEADSASEAAPVGSPRRVEPGSLARSAAPAGNVQLVVDGAETDQPINVPVYSSEQADQWHRAARPVLPPQVIEQLQRSGHEVNHQQQYIVVDTDDGKQVLFPVDNYQISPPRRQAY